MWKLKWTHWYCISLGHIFPNRMHLIQGSHSDLPNFGTGFRALNVKLLALFDCSSDLTFSGYSTFPKLSPATQYMYKYVYILQSNSNDSHGVFQNTYMHATHQCFIDRWSYVPPVQHAECIYRIVYARIKWYGVIGMLIFYGPVVRYILVEWFFSLGYLTG